MIELLLGSSVALTLLTLLFYASSSTADETEFARDSNVFNADFRPQEQFSGELVLRLFSREDSEFIARQGSTALNRIFRRERKAVALHWIRGISADISRTMREHLKSASRSANLKVSSELQMVARFLAFRLVCGLLVVLTKFVRLHVLLNLAMRTGKLAATFAGSQNAVDIRHATPATYTIQ